jgi:hypothetical protein
MPSVQETWSDLEKIGKTEWLEKLGEAEGTGRMLEKDGKGRQLQTGACFQMALSLFCSAQRVKARPPID